MIKSFFSNYDRRGKHRKNKIKSSHKNIPPILKISRCFFYRYSLVYTISIILIFSTLTGTAVAWHGNCLTVDGTDDYVDLINEGTVDVATDENQDFTVEFWVYPTGYGCIIADDAYDIGYNSISGSRAIDTRLWLDGTSNIEMYNYSNLHNDWHHVMVMFDNLNNKAAIGIDGDISWYDNINDDDGLYNDVWPFVLGSFTSSSGFFQGKIDEVRISDGLRYTGDSYSVPTLPFSSDVSTLALWHFNETPGATSFTDSTGKGNTLTAHNGATTVTSQKVATPEFSPEPGIYSSAQDIFISCDTPAVLITYTTDGSDPDENATPYDGTAVSISETTILKARAFKDGWIPSHMSAGNFIIEGGNRTSLYFLDNEVMSPEIGDPIPWITKYIYPQGVTTSMQWQTTLEGDITSSFQYSIDVVECEAAAILKLEYIIERDGIQTIAATEYIDVDLVPQGYYQSYEGAISGLDLQTEYGDTIIFKITHAGGTKRVAIAIDGIQAYNDSHIEIFYPGLNACFTASPEKGDITTWFEFDASCSSDNNFPLSQLEVRWDWDNDGNFDTGYTTEKTASHQFTTPGIKSIRLQIKNPEEATRTTIQQVEIDLAVLAVRQLPEGAPAGLAWDGFYLWLSDSSTETISQLTADGQVINTFSSPCGDPLDLTWDGSYLWIIDAWGSDGQGNILYKVDTSGTVITSFNLPADISTGLTWDGNFLWAADGTNGRIVKIHPDTGEVITSFDSPGPNPRGLAWDGQYLWNADWAEQVIYKIDTEGSIINAFPSPGSGPMGLAWDGAYVWCVDLNSYTLFQVTDTPAAGPGALSITPTADFCSSGFVHGNFSPASTTYVVKNNGSISIEWALSRQQPWLDLSVDRGFLAPGDSEFVTASINANAATLGVGSYTDTLAFVNVTEGNQVISRTIILVVNPAEGTLEVIPSSDFTPLGQYGGSFRPESQTYTLKNIGSTAINWQGSRSETALWLDLSNEGGNLKSGETAEVTVSLNATATILPKGTYSGTVTFTNTTNGNGNTNRKAILGIDLVPSTISCELSRTRMIIGEPLRISGEISPAPPEGGAFVHVDLTSPTGNTISRTVLANEKGRFSYDNTCEDITQDGIWTVRTRWSGAGGLAGAISPEVDAQGNVLNRVEVSKAETRVTLDVTSQAIKSGDSVSISGKFTPHPDCEADLSGIPITLDIVGPGGTDSHTVQTNDQWGHFSLSNYAGFSGPDAIGLWTITARFVGNDAYIPATSDSFPIHVMETAGYAIVVQGKIASEEGLASHNKTTNAVYRQLRNRGLSDDDIMYFNYDTTQQDENNVFIVDDIPSKNGIQLAITQWAMERMNDHPANLYVVMVNHGLADTFYIYPDLQSPITATELDSWLDTLQGNLVGQAADQEIVVLLGFCRSGSFIDDVTGNKRVIIASAAEDESSYKGPNDGDVDGQGNPLREGEYFVSEFFKAASYGKSVKRCFQEAVELTENFTGSESVNAGVPFFDDSLQHPLLDDNGDGIGSNDLGVSVGDGLLSEKLFIGVSSVTGNDPGDVSLTEVADAVFINAGEDNTSSLWAKVDDSKRLRTIWVEIKPPGYTPVDPGDSGQVEMILSKTIGIYSEAEERYEWPNLGGFTDPGTYRAFYFARDDETGNVSSLETTTIYKAKSDNTIPDPFALILPRDGAKILDEVFLLDWEDSSDQDGDSLTYTVLFSEDDPNFINPMRKGGLRRSSYIGSRIVDGIKDSTHYYWKVQATDQYGGVRETSVREFDTNFVNFLIVALQVHVYSVSTGESITEANVRVGNTDLVKTDSYFFGLIPPGDYDLEVDAIGYSPIIYSSYTIPEVVIAEMDFGLEVDLTQFFGDIDGDSDVDLVDAIIVLQVLAGMQPSALIHLEADVNNDNKIGLAEVIYIMQEVAQLR